MLRLAEPHVLSLKPYVAGKSIDSNKSDMIWAKLASNENCLGPSTYAIEAAAKNLSTVHLYPNRARAEVIQKICASLKDFSIKPHQVALGNGSSELIVNVMRGLLGADEAVLYCWPTFVMYKVAAHAQGKKQVVVPLKSDMSYDVQAIIDEANSSPLVKLIFLANPNNPTGSYINASQLEQLVKEIPKSVVLVIDEAYCEYVLKKDYPNGLVHALSRPRTVVLRTFSKIYGLAGMRIGYAIGDEKIIDILCRIRDPFNVNALAQYAAIAALQDDEHVTKSIEHNRSYLPKLQEGLRSFGFMVPDGVGNFVMAQKSKAMPGIQPICDDLLKLGVIIRPLDSFGIPDAVRVSVGTEKEIKQFFDALEVVFKG